MANDLKIGDVVKLKSGGVRMTAVNPDYKGEVPPGFRSSSTKSVVLCAWQLESGEVSSHGFPPDALEKDENQGIVVGGTKRH